ncbi:MAG: response regulator transcription factor [Planctomycetes bacterium]|nr:response regulator transcription factor [Planctomycetota bacterium]
MTQDRPIKVLLVDDHPVVRRGIAQLIRQEAGFSVVAEAESVPEAVEAVRAHVPDVLVVDLTLKGASGMELIKQVRTDRPHLPVLVVSMHDERIYAERCLRMGANGYVMKEEAAEVIIAAIRRIMDGGTWLSERLMSAAVQRMVGGRQSLRGATVASLSDRELEVFQLIGRGFGTKSIAEQLKLSVKTVEAHKANIKGKLGVRSAPELQRLAVTWTESRENGDRGDAGQV